MAEIEAAPDAPGPITISPTTAIELVALLESVGGRTAERLAQELRGGMADAKHYGRGRVTPGGAARWIAASTLPHETSCRTRTDHEPTGRPRSPSGVPVGFKWL